MFSQLKRLFRPALYEGEGEQPRTVELRRKLKAADWFCNGGSLSAQDETAVTLPVESLAMAVRAWFDKESCEVRQATLAKLMSAVSERYGWELWEARMDLLERHINSLVQEKLATPAMRDRVGLDMAGVRAILKRDLLELCLACEFKPVVHTKFYDAMQHWYLAGHFPCGWVNSGQMHEGRRVGKLAVW